MPTRHASPPRLRRDLPGFVPVLLTWLVFLLGSHGWAQGWSSTRTTWTTPLDRNTPFNPFTMQRTHVTERGWNLPSTTTLPGTTICGSARYDVVGTRVQGHATVMIPGGGTAFGTSTSTLMGRDTGRTTSTWILPSGGIVHATSRSTPTAIGGTRTSTTWSSAGTRGSVMGFSTSTSHPDRTTTVGVGTTTLRTSGFDLGPLGW